MTPDETKRFWAKVQINGPEECWPWLAYKCKQGYARFRSNGMQRQASRLALRTVSPKPYPHADALHSCDNRACVNPAHLRWGNAKENAQDREDRQRGADQKGTANPSAKLQDWMVIEIYNSSDRGCDLAKRFRISQSIVSQIRNKQIWTHLTQS